VVRCVGAVDASGGLHRQPSLTAVVCVLRRTPAGQVRQGDQHVHQFFRLLALCHTVMPEFKEGTSPPASYHQLRSAVPWEYSAHTVSAVWVIPCMHLAASSESAGHNTTAASALLADR